MCMLCLNCRYHTSKLMFIYIRASPAETRFARIRQETYFPRCGYFAWYNWLSFEGCDLRAIKETNERFRECTVKLFFSMVAIISFEHSLKTFLLSDSNLINSSDELKITESRETQNLAWIQIEASIGRKLPILRWDEKVTS